MSGDGQPHDRSALILYGSETGTAQDGAEQLGSIMQRLRFETVVVEMDAAELSALLNFTVVIVAISTTGQGDIPANARRFWKTLLRKRLAPDSLAHVPFTTFGFGDSSYVKFNWAARKLHKRLEQLGANEIYPRGEADEQHEEGTDGAFLPWSLDLRLHLLQRFPLPENVLPIADSELLPPQWTVKLVEPPPDATTTSTAARQSPDTSSATASPALSSQQSAVVKMDRPFTNLSCITGAVSEDETVHEDVLPPEDLLPVPNCYQVCCEFNERITPKTHWQDVRHMSFVTDGTVKYLPGDVITIYPKNFPQDVDSLIKLQGWKYVADKEITISATKQNFLEKSYIPRVGQMRTVDNPTLRSLLINNLDINAIPRRSFFDIISKLTNDQLHRERLIDFTNPAYSQEFFDYTSRPRRSILEVLHDFPSVRIPWYLAPSIIPELRGRQFSICSGGELKCPVADQTAFHICVALVKYQTVLKKIRQGVCSRYLATLKQGALLNISLTQSHSFEITKEKFERPIVMIAPGTGIAPIRSLAWERLQFRRRNESVKMERAILIYGARNCKADFHFQDEWEDPDLDIKLHPAFSRDQKEKIYVQDVVRKRALMIHEALINRQGSVIVCGSSGKMPIAVRAAIVDAFFEIEKKKDFSFTKEQAEGLLLALEKGRRYTQETW